MKIKNTENTFIYHADCFDLIDEIKNKINIVVTDPPYGIGLKGNGSIFNKADRIEGDEDQGVFIEMHNKLFDFPMICFYSPYNPTPIKWRSILVWEKGEHVGGGGDTATCWKRNFELIGVRNNKKLKGRRDGAILKYNALLPPPSGHPAEKPIPLMMYLIEKTTSPEDIILDPFMGSGSTGIACLRTGRGFIGIEKSKRWFDYSKNRITMEAKQIRLFK